MYDHVFSCFFFFNDTATTEIYTLSLHDALPISATSSWPAPPRAAEVASRTLSTPRSEEHTSELQSLRHLVCRLLLEKKKKHAPRLDDHNKENRPHLVDDANHRNLFHHLLIAEGDAVRLGDDLGKIVDEVVQVDRLELLLLVL